jgi:hypothetical protein
VPYPEDGREGFEKLDWIFTLAPEAYNKILMRYIEIQGTG